ncbi:hypothetical protein GS580_27655 [Rhodococcus hoagii]|nr:hypothetical protein [Prescottella equi]
MVALLKTRGYLIETIESTDTSVTVRGTDPQTGSSRIDVDDRPREEGRYTSNKKYDTDPQAMLYAKAATEVARARSRPRPPWHRAHPAKSSNSTPPCSHIRAREAESPRRRCLEAALTPAAETEPALDADSLLAAVEQAPDIESLREMWTGRSPHRRRLHHRARRDRRPSRRPEEPQ